MPEEAETALAISVAEAGSCSGGEFSQRCMGFMSSYVLVVGPRVSRGDGVPRLRGMSMLPTIEWFRTLGDVERGWVYLLRRR